MRAVILAGGKGRRLLPYTTVFPKPLMPIGTRPIVDLIVRQLVHAGMKDITLSTGHLGELIEAYFQNGNGHFGGLKLSYCRERKPLGTAGPLSMVPGLKETFLVMNGDVLTNLDFQEMIAYHRSQRAALTIAVKNRRIALDYGTLLVRSDGSVSDYKEKPVHEVQVSMGVYIYEPEVLDLIRRGEYLDFPELVLRLLEKGRRVAAYENGSFWLDIGKREDYEKALSQFEEKKHEFDNDLVEAPAR